MKLPSRHRPRPTHKMRHQHHPRFALLLAFGCSSFVYSSNHMAAQSLPAMHPTALAAQAPSTTPAAAPNTPHRAEVLFTGGQVQVRADNSSLNQILRSISQRTGLTITGGVEDQRVFGSYGPGPLSTVLATLLDGTGVNILFLAGNADHKPELILTQINGGADPPGPNSSAYSMYDDNSGQETPVPPAVPAAQPSAAAPPTSTAPRLTSPVVTPGPIQPQPATRTSSPPPNPALTPEMVEKELMQMQAQQKAKMNELNEKVRQEQLQTTRPSQSKQSQPGPNSPQSPQ